jgi:hypothetical protein
MKSYKMVLTALSFAVLLAPLSASAETKWDKEHPRQHKVLKGANGQKGADNKAFKNGKITGNQDKQLKREDNAIKREDRRDAKINGGYITKGQKQHMLNQEKNVNKQLKADEKRDAGK